MDIFTWSIPFVSEKITEMLHVILKLGEGEFDESTLNETDKSYSLIDYLN